MFPSEHESIDPRSGVVRRHHIYEQSIQRAIKRAVTAAKLTKPASTTPCATALRRTCSNRATTSAPSRNC